MTEPGYVAFLRHGAYHQRSGTPSARQPFPLTEQGQVQARAGAGDVAQMIRDHDLRLAPVLHCSRQLRAWQTAEQILSGLREHGYTLDRIEQTSALAERGMGSAANLTTEEIETVLRDDPRHGPPPKGWKSDSDYRLPLEDAESLMDAGLRVARHLQETVQPGLLTIHVGHGASFRHACHHLGLLHRAEIAKLSMFHARPLLLCHNGHGSWRHLAGKWKVRSPKEDPID
ncbi:histidine phosphatase family protein [Puniceibacterium sp. IMCC21224]|uniref:histidine phosphatase family protein n=1 Tax=Puniceibacterium sp. IMCC21224 TaxID=1618204 RepID=UPI00064E02EC|nr:histidine phosphatase family protein [Puniceibacterium sp. IMCC21224]